MAEVPDRAVMTDVLQRTVERAESELGAEEGARLAEVMRALCLDLTDLEARYYVIFNEDGGARFSVEDPQVDPMLTIATTAVVFHKMAVGESNPALEFAMRKVKMSGVPMPKLVKVGGNLIDTLFSCYRACV
ncbi:MAG: SCP2 sterol-binding domain-containing protein [Candidatus Geothermincolia bacterium]